MFIKNFFCCICGKTETGYTRICTENFIFKTPPKNYNKKKGICSKSCLKEAKKNLKDNKICIPMIV
jgi:hypothetical protein